MARRSSSRPKARGASTAPATARRTPSSGTPSGEILLAADHLIAHISSNPLITRPLDGSDERTQALVSYRESLRKTREMPAEIVLPGPRRADHRPRRADRRADADDRAAQGEDLEVVSGAPRTGHEIAQELWGNVAVTQAFLTLSEVIGHVDLLMNEGMVREVERRGSRALRARLPERDLRMSAMEALDPVTRAAPVPDRRDERRAASGEEAHAGHRQPVRDDGLGPAEEPRRLRAPGPLPGRGGHDRGAEPRDRDRARGDRRRLRRCRRLRRRRHLNEVAHGLAGTDVPVTMLPGGSTNVVCRSLGIPDDVVDATEHLLGLADDFQPRKIDLGLASGRHFVFACGAGLDAMVVKRVDAHPKLKTRFGEWYYTYAAVTGFNRHYLMATPRACACAPSRARSRGSRPSLRTPTRSPTSATARSASARASRSTTGPCPSRC